MTTCALKALAELRATVEEARSRVSLVNNYGVFLDMIDRKMEELDRVGCESSDAIDEGLRA